VVRDILIHLGEPITPPTMAPARGPPLWAAQDDAASDATASDAFPIADIFASPGADFSFDQRIRLVVRHPSAPPWRGGSARAGRCPPRQFSPTGSRHRPTKEPYTRFNTAGSAGIRRLTPAT
jgi:hypothetical protein